MIRIDISIFMTLVFLIASTLLSYGQGIKEYSTQSIIVESEGESCLGQEHSRSETQRLALIKAKRNASEFVRTYITSESKVESGKLVKDLVNAYSKTTVRVLQILENRWIKSNDSGGFTDFCYRIKIKAEVIPKKKQNTNSYAQNMIHNPAAPLSVELWTDKDTYHIGDTMKFYFRGNKPFYARAVYKTAESNIIEVTPSRNSRYYQGGVVYEIPGKNDLITLMITPPLGNEKLTLYASGNPMNKYESQKIGNFYFVDEQNLKKLSITTRGLTIMHGIQTAGLHEKAEFAEVSVDIMVTH
ncbi:DUF4384 domain-containing protein [Desulfoplanes sp.]